MTSASNDASLAAPRRWLDDHRDDLVEDLRSLIRIPSTEGKATPGAPFGETCREALDFTLDLARDRGWSVTDLDGYCGFAEIGDGAPMVMVLGHLDVVPVGPGWKYEPFGAEIDGGWLYGRGAIDDKGPTMAATYAAFALAEAGLVDGVRLRLVFGCDEESGFGCVKHYRRVEEPPTFGLAPDARWPLVHAEKGIVDLVVEVPRPGAPMELVDLRGGQRSNIVIDRCTATVRVDSSVRDEVVEAVDAHWDRNVSTRWDDTLLHIDVMGKAAHGSVPYAGDSAAIRALRYLRDIAPLAVERAYTELFQLANPTGEALRIAGADEVSGPLSSNLGLVAMMEGQVAMTLNVRYPATWTVEPLLERVRGALAATGGRLVSVDDNPPLHVSKDHPLVAALCDVYEAETGHRLPPAVMGGGTYARAMPNTVAIGTGWEGDGPAHETDERVKIDHLHRMGRIYLSALARTIALASATQT